MEQGLVTTEQSIALSPADVVKGATTQARLLMDIVNKTKCYQEIRGQKYLQLEAWETIGAFNSIHAVTEWIHPIIKDDVTVGYDAKVNLVNLNGIAVGGAIMPCYFSENACKGKVGDSKDKACKSAAQTFATSKAYRMNYSYVAILAGYQPLPAEELPEDSNPSVDKTKHWCQDHDTEFFKRGKMKSYAHPIGDTDEWCHEHKEKPIIDVKAEAAPANGKAEEVLQFIADKMKFANTKTARKWLVDSMGIEDKRIDSNPETVLKEVADLKGWNL